jgi:maltooligosyltrehalose trehalohydrolase
MGEEYGEEAPFQYFVSHSDLGLIEAVRKGREEEFAAFEWEGEVPDPQDEKTFLRSKVNLGLRRNGSHGILLEFYKTLIRMRKEIPCLSHPGKKGTWIRPFHEEKAIIMERQYGEDRAICVFNFSDRPIKIKSPVEKGKWQNVLHSASERWGGTGVLVPESFRSDRVKITFRLDPYAFAVYKRLSESTRRRSWSRYGGQ